MTFGIFTTDDRLVIRTWDAWLVEGTGIAAEHAIQRPLPDVFPEAEARGLLAAADRARTEGTIQVLAPALHHYVIACAPSRPSRRFDRMQQQVTVGPLRDGRRVVGVMVTIEDVTARMEQERELAEQRHLGSLTQLMGDADWRVRRTAVTTLAEQGPVLVDTLVRTLRRHYDDISVLSSALDLLAIRDIDVIDPVAAFLQDPDPNLRMQAALILGERENSRAIPHLLPRLADPDVNVRFHVIEALGRLQAREAADALIAIAEEREFFLAFPAIQALSRIGLHDVAPRLVPLLADEMLREPAIEALGELGDDAVAAPLVGLLDEPDAPVEVIAEALAGLCERYQRRYEAGEHIAAIVRREISATGVRQILDAVQRAGAERLGGLARVLGWLDSEAAQQALARLLGQPAVRSQVVEALVRSGAAVVELLVEQLRAEDLETRQAAAVALGRIGHRQATPALVAALADPELALPAANALARIGDRAAFDALMGLVAAPDIAVRQAAIAALNSIGHPDMPGRIAPLLGDVDPIVRESAVRIAGYFGYPQALEPMLARVRDEHDRVRAAAVETLPMFEDGARVLEALTVAIATDTARVRAAAAGALAHVDHPEAVNALVGALEDADAWVRYAALRSIGAKGDLRAAPAVIDRLQHDPAPHVRLAALDAVGRLDPPGAIQVLEPFAASEDRDVAQAAIRAIGHLGRPDALSCLERFLHAPEWWRRLEAVTATATRWESAVVRVLQWTAAADDHPEVSGAAIDALARIGRREDGEGPMAARALVALSAEPEIREAVVAALGTLPSRLVGEIAAGLRHPVTEVRRACVEALGRMKRPEASRALEEALEDAVPAVRLTAIDELRHLGTRAPARALLRMARADPDAAVRRAAMQAMNHGRDGATAEAG